MLDFRMKTFLTLCDTMNYREAAERLHITQPAVTQHIQFLEGEYQCRLFVYENRSLRKTEAARILEQYAHAVRYNDDEIRRHLLNCEVRELRIGATKTIGDYVLPDRIQRFLRRKDTTLTMIVDNTERLLRLLEEDKLDFAIVEGYFDKNRFDSRCLRTEPFVGICRKGHPFTDREISMQELLTETLIHREEGSGTRAILEQTLRSRNESLSRFPRHICLSSFKLILELVREGFGVSFVYNVLADSDPGLDKFRIQGDTMIREFNLVWLKHADVREKIELFFVSVK